MIGGFGIDGGENFDGDAASEGDLDRLLFDPEIARPGVEGVSEFDVGP